MLITKLRSANTVETRQYRKASKALLVLIPLLGITYLVLLYGPNEGVGNYIFVVARAFLLSTQVSNQFWIIQMAVTLISIRTENSEQRDGTKKKWTNGGREWHLYLAKPFHHFSHQHCAVGCAGEIVSQNASHKTMKSVTSRLRSVNFRHFQPDVERKTYLFAERTLPLAVIKTFFLSRYSIAFRSQFISGHEQ